ncbi:unnamed protein product [Didymodactylos carnosus]|uniref:CMP/dCMP-type deaminase domain-containing protein n=1 Tax=Didymodactylos carnosus TaxID=1234261 RepID=A0A815WPP2_9BILA|nr:unnamed protein product [Didymodactylos carnosus]CAF1544547.1 unnamed protein product [Didymodactylos carnosus]CAF4208621.1 unnamed protein product [Didymodactylos carnosus]CAF4405157.1 unnamed protein product [Didymodactylos carnosus]
MLHTLQLARSNKEAFTAIIVDRSTNKIVAESSANYHNNPLQHSETAVLEKLIEKYTVKQRLNMSLTLYTTAEPCPMCSGAITWLNITEIVYCTNRPCLYLFGETLFSMRANTIFHNAYKTSSKKHPIDHGLSINTYNYRLIEMTGDIQKMCNKLFQQHYNSTVRCPSG